MPRNLMIFPPPGLRRPSRALPFALLACVVAPAPAQEAAPHRVVVTTPDLAALVRAIGGERVDVECLARPAEDSHYVMARPSMTRSLADAELLVEIGRDLEIGWLPVLVQQCRNRAVQTGQPGRFVAADHVRALGVPSAGTDRRHGDVHASGNPHFLLDPLCGLQVAAALRQRMTELWPADKEALQAGFMALRRDLAVGMVGAVLAERYGFDAERLALLHGAGKLRDVLLAQGDAGDLRGWFAEMEPLRGSRFVGEHDVWAYFAERFGLSLVACLEPQPGIAPTARHLREVVDTMRREHVGLILSLPYFSPRHAQTVAGQTGASIAPMEHQPGARRSDGTYVGFVAHNVAAVVAAARAGARKD